MSRIYPFYPDFKRVRSSILSCINTDMITGSRSIKIKSTISALGLRVVYCLKCRQGKLVPVKGDT